MTPKETDAALEAAVAPELIASATQVDQITASLTTWVRKRALPGDARVAILLDALPAFSRSLKFSLNHGGLRVEAPYGDRTALRLERGATWFRGGSWQNVALACVSMETPKP